ncbi:hypothetical protein ATL40_1840 [Serinibacter salmoneus]|uniref:Uncharacterized protein n=2 Tax=Serinibacter salmoneus TaxID=556530 RepID=A0A2A9D0Q7_9MICO|nr:hypothetical protein ATL40_1840 [Serinibacter salmoneus]
MPSCVGALAVAALLLAGCTESGDEDGEELTSTADATSDDISEATAVATSEESVETTAEATAEATATAQEALEWDSRDWDEAAWEPTVEITPTTYTEAELQASYEEGLAELAASLQLDSLPEVEFERWTETVEDSLESDAQCLTEQGFEVNVEGGTLGFTDVDFESEEFQRASYICAARFPLHPRYTAEWTEDQKALVYDFQTEFTIPCIEALGHEVDVSERPTRQEWIATFSFEDNPWSPLHADTLTLGLMDEEDLEALGACGSGWPPLDVLYGL